MSGSTRIPMYAPAATRRSPAEMARGRRDTRLPAPWLRSIALDGDGMDRSVHPFDLPWLTDVFELEFETAVTILMGENGSGKSTLLEAIAALAGFPTSGGDRWRHTAVGPDSGGSDALANRLRAGWLPKVGKGWFLKAQSFAAVSDMTATDYLAMSHGEGFAEVIAERMVGQGIFLLDEPEAALSPRKQVELLRFLGDIEANDDAQVFLATHSPILMAVPGATVLRLSRSGIERIDPRHTDHFRIWQAFAIDPDGFVADIMEGDLGTLI